MSDRCTWIPPLALLVLVALAPGCRHATPALGVPEPLVVDDVRLEGFAPLSADERDALRARLPLQPGDALTDEAERAAAEAAMAALQDRGHPYATVGIAREGVVPGRSRVIVLARPGTPGFFGPIEIAGNRRVDDRIIRRRIAYVPGDPFSRSAIERSQRRIGALGLFSSVEIRARDVDTQPAVVPTIVTVKERSPWQWNLSLGYAAGERLGVDARLSHLNAFGAARRIDLEGRVSRIERLAEAAFTQMDTWHPSLSLSVQARHWEIDEQAFDVQSRGGQAAATWQWSRALATTLAYAAARERSRVDSSLDLLTGLQDGMLSAWSIDVGHRASAGEDAPPDRVLRLHLEQAGGWMPGSFHYYNLDGDARRYHRMLDGRVVLAGRIRYGAIDPMGGEADVPLLKRFFLGGPGDLRGWGRYEVSPLAASGVAVGGKSLFLLAAEARVPIVGRLRGAAFVEAGNVWPDAWALDPGDLLSDAGAGLRLATPFGLIRVDVGHQLRRLEGLRLDGEPQRHRWRLHLGIGEAF